MEPRAAPMEPRGTPMEPRGTPMEPRGTPMEPRGTPMEPRGFSPGVLIALLKRASPLPFAIVLFVIAMAAIAADQVPASLDKSANKWIDQTLKKMTLDEKVGQLMVVSTETAYLADDSEEFDRLARQVRDLHVGGLLVLGATERAPSVLFDSHYGTVVLGEPVAAASLVNRLQSLAKVPLLVAGDFETGVAFRIRRATAFPREMAVAAAGDTDLAREVARLTAVEARALGVQMNLAPVADVNNNPRNPVINTRSFGESPDAVARFTAAYVEGFHQGGVLSALKHFPGHGDTDVDSHLGLPIVRQPRDRIESVELAPFRAGIAAGADAVMTAHIEVPALDPEGFSPATLSRPITTDLLRGELKFEGLVVTDALDMEAIRSRIPPGDAAVRAVFAGSDLLLKVPDVEAAIAGVKAAVAQGVIPPAQLDASVRRILEAKARLGLHTSRAVALDDVPKEVGGRSHQAVAEEASRRSITLVKDDRHQMPLRVPGDAAVLCLSLLDYPSGWSIAAPGRTFIPELKRRWPNVTAVELSDRSSPSEIDFVRATAARYDAIVAAVFVRTVSGSGRMDLSPPLVKLLADLARLTAGTPEPFITVFFGNPYIVALAPQVPAAVLTYDLYDLPEASAVRAIAGEAPITGRLPISLPGMFEAGWGLNIGNR